MNNDSKKKKDLPSDEELIECIAHIYGVSFGRACDWILEIAERMKVSP